MECQEIFLNDIVKVEVFAADSISFPTPSTIPGVRSFTNIYPSKPLISYAYDGTEAIARENSISIKQTPQLSGSRIIYIYNVDATLEEGYEQISDQIDLLMNSDYNIVLTKQDGSLLLLYTLPNSFSVNATDNLHEMTLKLSISSVNNFIPLTFQPSKPSLYPL